MESQNRSDTKYIIWEATVGILLGVVFIIIVWNNDDLLGKTIEDGIVRIYGGLSLTFLFSVLSVGIIGAIKQKQNDKIGRAIAYAIFFWIISIPISAVVASFFAVASLLIVLGAIILGFNIGLRRP